MLLKKLILYNFKNYDNIEINFDQSVCLIHGKNGSGKTNLLDAIHYISLTKSYFGLGDKYLMKHDQEGMRVQGHFIDGDKKYKVAIKCVNGKKKEVTINDKKLEKPGEILGMFPLVFVSPDDIKVVKNNSKDRRDFVNKIICQVNPHYLRDILSYNRLLRQKTAALKTPYPADKLTIVTINQQMLPLISSIIHERQKLLKEIVNLTQGHYNEISNGAETVKVKYQTQFKNDDHQSTIEEYVDLEIATKRVHCGIHKDDFSFLLGRYPLKKFGSQGQIKTFLYALKLAEFEFLEKKLMKKPILILDDLFEKLDQFRLNELLKKIGTNQFKQVVISDTELDRSKVIFENHQLNIDTFEIENGQIAS